MSLNKEEMAQNRDQVFVRTFRKRFRDGLKEIPFSMDDIRNAIQEVAAANPGYREKNVADVRYQYTSGRRELPSEINRLGPWMIQGRGKGRYAFVRLKDSPAVRLSDDLCAVLLPDATPEIVMEYAGGDEQGLLAKIRYNRLLDVFLGITCYHLQNHWRTSIKNKGQCEIDDLYVGLDTNGKQYVLPVEAKCCREHLSKTQIAQMIDFARERYPRLKIRPIGVQEMRDGNVTLVEFSPGASPDKIKIRDMRRYRLVPMSECPVNEENG